MKKRASNTELSEDERKGNRKKSTKSAKVEKNIEKSKLSVPKKLDVKPYREIIFSDGHGFYIKTTCNLTSDDRVQVIQYREHIDPEGSKFACTEPTYFENKEVFLKWLFEMLKKNFDDIPYITITPIEVSKIKKHEREATDTMYL
jgi:hypothetical protein